MKCPRKCLPEGKGTNEGEVSCIENDDRVGRGIQLIMVSVWMVHGWQEEEAYKQGLSGECKMLQSGGWAASVNAEKVQHRVHVRQENEPEVGKFTRGFPTSEFE